MISGSIYSSNFFNNYANNDGGAIYSEDSIYLNSNIFKSNFAKYTSNGGAIFCNNFFDFNSTYILNSAGFGSAIYSYTNSVFLFLFFIF